MNEELVEITRKLKLKRTRFHMTVEAACREAILETIKLSPILGEAPIKEIQTSIIKSFTNIIRDFKSY